MSKIFDALRKAELEPSPLAPREETYRIQGSTHPRRVRTFEREFGGLSSAIQSYYPRAQSGKVLIVTGCVEREGTSYVSSNLARSLAASAGAPVLYVDANFHDPALARNFQVPDGVGLADVYTNGKPRDLTDFIYPGDRNNLYLLGAGQRRVAPVAFFASGEFDALLSSLRKTFRFVVVDTPPVLKYADSLQLAARSDGVVFVVRYKNLKREVVRKGVEMIESVNGPILGVVLNRRRFAIPSLIYKLIS